MDVVERKKGVVETEGFDFFSELGSSSARESWGRRRVRGVREKFEM